MRNKPRFRHGVALLPLVAGIAAGSVQAAAVLEEVIVTATLRAESLQDVPVSVNAVSGEKMMEAGIDKIEDLQAYVPNLTMSETGIGTNIYVRGIGSGINQGFEQSVGMYFDGVSYGRAQLSRAPFLDLARVEVLRGPQNILFGKNSVAGALSLHSQRPGMEFEGMVSGLYEPTHGERTIDVVLSGPLTDRLGARLAIRKRDMDGYIENLTLDQDEPERDEGTARLILDWAATDDLQAMFKFEVGKFDVTGRQIEIINDQNSTSPVFGNSAFGPDVNGDGGRNYSEILFNTNAALAPGVGVSISSDSSVLNNELDYKRSSNGDFSNNDTQNFTMNLDYAWGEHTLTAITGIMSYEYEELCDCDFTGAELFKVEFEEEYTQISQEFRIASPVGNFVEYIGGLYLHKSELDFYDSILVTSNVLPDLINFADAIGPPPGSRGRIQDGAGDAGDEIRDLGTPREFTTDTELWSTFLQLTFNLSDTLRLNVGGRYSSETKEGSRSLDFENNKTGERLPNGEVDSVVAINFSAERHNLEGKRDESNFSPSVNLQWDFSDWGMSYFTWSKGFKSGGFDARSNGSPAANNPDPGNVQNPPTIIGSFAYEEEKSTSYEIGAKTTLLDGAAELNIAMFYTEFDDLQISIFDGTLGFNVGNAGAAETMGLELDGRLAITEKLMMTGALAFLDFEFTDFKNGQCNHVQVRNGQDPDGDRLCDFTGETNQYVADFSGNIGLVYTTPVADSLEFRGGLDIVFTDDYNPTQNLDPTQEQDGYAMINGRLALSDFEDGWELALVGKNLTDEEVVNYANDTPLANSIFGSVNHYGFVARPRSIGLQAVYRWY
ncbi:outer membrane receptor protein involved in Fe transport [Litorivivens lipolytica]|uniref:Outer membrane receptor protein involved in Fe transport n=1 Tax=Litorivivens lipolytica TaxID=1524264 RepID=A0A7W4W2H6_9GAMM|nr:TonB-dependent receptor [Litorivivens lipolytica]MBB3046241.1 outer membrane receptor protein involved in Fe transport [Litorivivens lipolytica]